MAAVENTPVNKNFLSPLNFKFFLKRAPHVNFFVTKANIPSLRLPTNEIPTIFNRIPNPIAHIDYGMFEISFQVDEDLNNYMELHNWIRGLGFPEKFEEYAAIKNKSQISGEGLTSDLGLIILNSTKTPNFQFTFRDAFPVYLSDVVFDTTLQDVQYLTATAQFQYTLYDVTVPD